MYFFSRLENFWNINSIHPTLLTNLTSIRDRYLVQTWMIDYNLAPGTQVTHLITRFQISVPFSRFLSPRFSFRRLQERHHTTVQWLFNFFRISNLFQEDPRGSKIINIYDLWLVLTSPWVFRSRWIFRPSTPDVSPLSSSLSQWFSRVLNYRSLNRNLYFSYTVRVVTSLGFRVTFQSRLKREFYNLCLMHNSVCL